MPVSGVHYVSSKSGIIGLVKQLSHEFGKYNIRINCLCPSQTLTPMLLKSMNKSKLNILKNFDKSLGQRQLTDFRLLDMRYNKQLIARDWS